MKPILGARNLYLAVLFCAGLCIAQEKTNRTPTSSEELSAGFQCPGKDANQPRPNVKIKLRDVTKKAVKLPKPRYPQLAKAAGLYGNVQAEVVIDMNSGSVIWAQVIIGHPLLKEAVKDVVCGARFAPINDADGGASGFLTYKFVRRR